MSSLTDPSLEKLKSIYNQLQQSQSPRAIHIFLKDFVFALDNPLLKAPINALEKIVDEKIVILHELEEKAEEELEAKVVQIREYLDKGDVTTCVIADVKEILLDDIHFEFGVAYGLFSKVKRSLLRLLQDKEKSHRQFIRSVAAIGDRGGIVTESISPAFNILQEEKIIELGEMPYWRSLVSLFCYRDQINYKPGCNASHNYAYHPFYIERRKILGHQFTNESVDVRLFDYQELKLAAGKILEYLEFPVPLKLKQNDVSLQQIDERGRGYLKIAKKTTERRFTKDPFIILREITKNIFNTCNDAALFRMTSKKKLCDKSKVLEGPQKKILRGMIRGINKRIKKELGVANFLIYKGDLVFVNKKFIE